jgi:hypothetical protein
VRFAIALVLAAAACSVDAPPRDTGLGSTSMTGDVGNSSEEEATSTALADTSTGDGVVVLELLPTDDASVEDNAPDNNFGSAPILEIENDEDVQIAYLRFVVDDIDGEILTASLRMLAVEGSDYAGDVFVVDDGDPEMGMQWTEDTLTFNNAPAVQGDPVATVAAAPSATYVSFDVTSAVALGMSHSFAITTMSADEIEYASKEGEEAPVLIVTVMTP